MPPSPPPLLDPPSPPPSLPPSLLTPLLLPLLLPAPLLLPLPLPLLAPLLLPLPLPLLLPLLVPSVDASLPPPPLLELLLPHASRRPTATTAEARTTVHRFMTHLPMPIILAGVGSTRSRSKLVGPNQSAIGRRRLNDDPLPGSLVTVILPPWASAIPRAM